MASPHFLAAEPPVGAERASHAEVRAWHLRHAVVQQQNMLCGEVVVCMVGREGASAREARGSIDRGGCLSRTSRDLAAAHSVSGECSAEAVN